METIQTAIEFVEKGNEEIPVSWSTQTGDFLWIFFVIAILALLISLYFVFNKKKKIFGSVVAVLAISLFVMNINLVNAVEKPKELSVPEKIQAIVDKDSHTVSFDEGNIWNRKERKHQLQKVSLVKVDYDDTDKWQINNNEVNLYDDIVGKSKETCVYISPQTEIPIQYNSSINYDKALTLVGKTAVLAKFEIRQCVLIKGRVLDASENPVNNVKVKFSDGVNTTTNEKGEYKLELVSGSKGTLTYSGAGIATINKDFSVPNEDTILDDVEVKYIANEPKVLQSKTYNGTEQVGVEGDNTIDLKSYSAKNAGEHTAVAKPVFGYAWPDMTDKEKSYKWYIFKSNACLEVPDFKVAVGGVTAEKQVKYNGELTDASKINISFDDPAVEVNKQTGSPQNFKFSIKCGECTKSEVKGRITYPACDNFNEVNADFKIDISQGVSVKGQINENQTEEGHTPSEILSGKKVKFTYKDYDEDEVVIFTTTNDKGEYCFLGVPKGTKGILTCNDFGYFGKTEAELDKNNQTLNIELTGPNFDNYSIEELAKASDLIAKNDEILKNEFTNYSKKNVVWFSQSNSLQKDDVKGGEISKADTNLCNHEYKNNLEIDRGKILPQDEDICQYLFLRVIGVNKDVSANEDGTVIGSGLGLTFQTVSSLPQPYNFQSNIEKNVSWWGDKNNDLRGNKIIDNLVQPYKDKIVLTQKKTFDGNKIKITGDKLFPLSYTEMCSKDPFYSEDYFKEGAEGQQYDWYATKNISGSNINDDLKYLGLSNSDEAMGYQFPIAMQRTRYPNSAAEQQYLTINNEGRIHTYNNNFTHANGYAPAFCMSNMENIKHFTLQGENVTFIDEQGNELCHNRLTTSSSFDFKLVPNEGVIIKSVTCDGTEISPVGDKYHADIQEESVIQVITEGQSTEAPYIEGVVNVEKHIGKNKSLIPYQNQHIKFVCGKNTFIANTDSHGKYKIELFDKIFEGKTGKIQLDSKPGVNAYEAEITLTLDKNIHNVNIHGLDFYTFEELSKVGDWLNEHENDVNLTDSSLYKEFDSYIENNTIWYSNSNGQQPDSLKEDNPAAANPALFNQDYKCYFDDATGNAQFLYLKVMDILHDKLTSGKGHAGLTFQTVHSLPVKTVFGGKTWADATLRKDLQRNGSIYKKISACNITDYIVTVDKIYQADRGIVPNLQVSHDKLFTLSYSEIWSVNGAMTQYRPWYDNSGNNTEGFVYKWNKTHNIDGSKSNNSILHMHWNNNNIQVGEKGATWERSVYYDNEAYSMLVRVGSPNSWNFDTSCEGIAPAFCLGGK